MSVRGMTTMSRAIREVLQQHGEAIKDIPDEELKDYAVIITAYSQDLLHEVQRRKEASDAEDSNTLRA